LICPGPRDTELVKVALNEPPGDGMRIRRAIGTEVATPNGPVN
jgi:hypothetical protein